MKMQINGKIVHKGYEDLWGKADLDIGILKFSARSRCVWLYNVDLSHWGRAPGTLWVGGCASPTAGVDTLGKHLLLMPGIGLSYLCRTPVNLVTALFTVFSLP